MREEFRVISLSTSEKREGPKFEVREVDLDSLGIKGDAHRGRHGAQVSVLLNETVEKEEKRRGRRLAPGASAENMVIDGINEEDLALFDLLEFDSAVLEITRFGKQDKDTARVERLGIVPLLPENGIFCRVLKPGRIKKGDTGAISRKFLDIMVITLSDRAYSGEYRDISGGIVKRLLEAHFLETRFRTRISSRVIPDEKDALLSSLEECGEKGFSMVFSTGSTGIGPRDIAPETVRLFCDRVIPGIMEAVRVKYGAKNPNAWLSRAIAGMKGEMAVFSIPGSRRAVEEYMEEILKVLDHMILMARGLGHK